MEQRAWDLAAARAQAQTHRPCAVAAFAALLCLSVAFPGCRKKTPPAAQQASDSAASSGPAASSQPPADSRSSSLSAQATGKDQPGSLAARLNAVESGEADKPGKAILPDLKPYPPSTAPPNIPLVKGLIIDGILAPNQKPQDSDHAVSIDDVTATQVLVNRGNDRAPTIGPNGRRKSPQGCKITVDKADFKSGNNYRPFVCASHNEHVPGTNPLGASAELFAQLKAGKQVEFHFNPDSDMTGELGSAMQLLGQKSDAPQFTLRAGIEMYTCTLHRVEPYDFAWSILLNEQPVDVPVVHTMCTFDDGEETHLYFLDQADNPLMVYGDFGVVPEKEALFTITVPSADDLARIKAAQNQMEQDLEQKKPVEIYGIYFDFDSAAIKPRSETVLKQIADILKKNPDWKLNVSGHTDNIGDDATNLALSQHRAAAVKDALVSRYAVSPERLVTGGFGASHAIADNNSILGRAKNRRVELQRQ